MAADPRWGRVKAIVGDALELDEAERDAFVLRACGDDPELLAEVRSLLETIANEDDPDFLEAPPPPERHTLGEFELLRELGRGAMGVVYLAWQSSLKREVAVKVMVESLTTTEAQVERFHREARAAAKLSHPGIVQVFADGQREETHWFAMQYVDGHDLAHELKLQRRESPRADARAFLPGPGEAEHVTTIARLCADVADALHHAHEHGLVHRDVKPQNLLLTPDGRIQIGDFGLVYDESLGRLTRTGEVAGTPHYMSPEQARIRSFDVDHRTDLYSLGVVLYEMCTLRRPFEGRSSAEVLTKIQRFEPCPVRKLDKRIPRDLETICQTAMARDPRDRYANARAMADDLRRFMNHQAVWAKPRSPLQNVGSWIRRHRVPLGAATLAIAGVWLGSRWAFGRERAKTLATVSVSVVGPVEPPAGEASFLYLDETTGVQEHVAPLGSLPITEARIPAGYGRIVVQLEDERRREATRHLVPLEKAQLELRVDPRQESTAGMRRIEGGVLRVDDSPMSALNLRAVEIAPFWLDECEVSVREYAQFLASTGHAAPEHWSRIDLERHGDLPVTFVSWYDANDYAEWAGKRLPTFAEWTFAARGTELRIYPWADPVRGELRGNTTRPKILATQQEERIATYFESAEGVRTREEARTPGGLYHMFGNVAEWTETPAAEPVNGTFVPRLANRLIAGHAWDAIARHPEHSLATFRFEGIGIEQAYARGEIGFRCARSVKP